MNKTSEVIRDAALKLFKKGANYREISQQLNISATTAHVLVDSKFAEHRRESINARRRGDSLQSYDGRTVKRPITLPTIPHSAGVK